MSKFRTMSIATLMAVFAVILVLTSAGPARALNPASTNGHQTVSAGSGTPTGVPTLTNADTAQNFFDTGANKLYVYNAGWQQVGVGGNYSLDRAVASVAVSNTTTETTFYSFSVPGGTLSTNHKLRIGIRGNLTTKNGGPGTFTVKVKYGSATLTAVSAANLTSNVASPVGVWLNADVVAANSASAQILDGFYSDAQAATQLIFNARATGSVTSASAQTLSATWQFGTADAANVFTLDDVFTEIVN